MKLLGSLTYAGVPALSVPVSLGIDSPLGNTSPILGPTSWAFNDLPESGVILSTLNVEDEASTTLGFKKL